MQRVSSAGLGSGCASSRTSGSSKIWHPSETTLILANVLKKCVQKLTPNVDSCLNLFGFLIPLRWALRSEIFVIRTKLTEKVFNTYFDCDLCGSLTWPFLVKVAPESEVILHFSVY